MILYIYDYIWDMSISYVWFYIYVYDTNILSKPRAPCRLEVSSLKGGLSIPGLLSWHCLGNSPAAKPRVAPGGVQCGLGAVRSEQSPRCLTSLPTRRPGRSGTLFAGWGLGECRSFVLWFLSFNVQFQTDLVCFLQEPAQASSEALWALY